MYPLNRTNNRGFTLVEVAVVMVIIGLIVTFAASILRNVGGLARLRDAKDRVASTTDSVAAFAAKNNRLPVFAEFSSTTGSFNYKDPWQRSYQLYPKLTPATFSNFTGNGLSTFCGRNSTRFSVCLNNDCTNNRIDDVAYALVSLGQNLALNSTYPAPSGCPSGRICLGVQEPTPTYDDLYKYVTLTELKKAAGCVASDAQLRIVNLDLPRAYATSSYKVPIVGSGGVPYPTGKYQWCVQTNPFNGVTFYADNTSTQIAACSSSYTAASFTNFSGIPSASGTVYVTVKDFTGNTASKTFVLSVN